MNCRKKVSSIGMHLFGFFYRKPQKSEMLKSCVLLFSTFWFTFIIDRFTILICYEASYVQYSEQPI